MRRYFILLGDKTTAGGVVIEAEERVRHCGKATAFQDASVYCPVCKSVGHIFNLPPYRKMPLYGRQVALENDLCLCKCEPPPRLLASQNTAWMSFNAEELEAVGFGADGRPMREACGAFDEQVLATGSGATDGYPYFVRMANGQTIQGRLDAEGYLPRIHTDAENDFHVYWGDDALAQRYGI